MGKRSDFPENAEGVVNMSLAAMNAEIQRCWLGYETGGSSQGRKSFFKRLVSLEAAREQVYGVPAAPRRFNSK